MPTRRKTKEFTVDDALAEARRMVEPHTEDYLVPHLMTGYILAAITVSKMPVWCQAYQKHTGCSDDYVATEILGG